MQIEKSSQLGTTLRLEQDFASTVTWTVEALKTEGFGVLTENDVQETLKKKLDKFGVLPSPLVQSNRKRFHL